MVISKIALLAALAVVSGPTCCLGLAVTIQKEPGSHSHGHRQHKENANATLVEKDALQVLISSATSELDGKADLIREALGAQTNTEAAEFLKGTVDRSELSVLESGGLTKAHVDQIFKRLMTKADPEPSLQWKFETLWCILMGFGLLLLLGIVLRAVLLSGSADESSLVAPTAAKGRTAVLDNAKFLAIPLVALYHMHCTTGACSYIAFHTRLFCFVSGLVSKSPPSMRGFKSLTFGLLVPILMYCFVLCPLVFPFIRGHFPTPDDYNYKRVLANWFKADARVIWFMIALLNWRLWGFLLMPLKPPVRLLVAVAVAALSGYVLLGDTSSPEDGAFKLGNAFVFLPVFVAGQLFPLEQVMEKVPYGATNFSIGAGVLSFIFVLQTSAPGLTFMEGINVNGGWSTESFDSAAEAGLYWTREIFFFNMLAIIKVLTFLICCCPRSSGIMSTLGQNSIYPYLLHVQFFDVINLLTTHCFGVQLYFLPTIVRLAIAFVLCTLLATWPVRSVFWIFLQPTWLENLLADVDEKDKVKESKPTEAHLVSKKV